MNDPEMVMIRLKNIERSYGAEGGARTHVLRQVSLDIREGEFLTIMGPSGAGKTTLLKCLAGLLQPTRGEVLLEGEVVRQPPRQMGYVSQDYSRSLLPWLRVDRNVTFPLRHKGVPRRRRAELAEETLRVAAETRRAWINAVSAWETVSYLNQAQAAADAASALAQKLGETGAFTKTGQAREHVFYAELAGQSAEARLAARTAKEELTRLMGLWGYDVDYSVPNALPALPKGAKAKRAIEAEALKNRVDLEIARLELEALAKSYGLTEATRYVTDLELLTGVEVEREESEEGGTETTAAPILELEFVIPIFDSGKARMRKAELAYMQAANLLAEKAVNIRSEARSAYDGYRSTYDIARHYRNNVVPLRQKIEEESVLTYNGMITNTFELLADTRAKVNSIILSLNAKRNFWLADVNLGTAVHGGGGSSAGGGGAPAVAEAGAEGH
jgi:outer membrane protein TolC